MTGIAILAAGASIRMGKAKQNLLYKDGTLLENSIKCALDAGVDIVAVVLGANAQDVVPTIKNYPVFIFENAAWQTGMGSSISCGTRGLLKTQPDLNAILFMLADQPLVTADAIDTLVSKATPGKMIASAYNKTVGAPVLFDQHFFDYLLAMQGNDGAKKLLLKYPEAVIEVPLAEAAFDIDTPEDYKRLSDR